VVDATFFLRCARIAQQGLGFDLESNVEQAAEAARTEVVSHRKAARCDTAHCTADRSRRFLSC
jgi:hypothetical protein